MNENLISKEIIDASLIVHKCLGPGMLESAYRECLAYELNLRGLNVEKEKPLPIVYKGIRLDHGYRIDLLVEEKVVVELKVVDSLLDVHLAQVLTYLRFGGYRLGLLLNFNVPLLKQGIRRVII